MPVSEDFTAPVTLPRMPGFAEAPYQMLAGKLTRLLARNVPTKKLTMRNTRPLVSFTFDDAAATACTAGAALLEQCHARGTFYVSGEKCGKPSPTGRLATVEQLKALHATGHELACHTFSHMPVVGISRQALASDLDRNCFFLQGILGHIPVSNFAYPYGDISFAAKRYLGGRYDSCRATTPGVNADIADLSVLKSNALEQASIGRQDVSHLITETVRRNGWLLFASHDVNDTPSQYGVRPEFLTFALRSALAAGCRIVTVAQALRILRGEEPGGEAA
ncbi:MAG TPA: polysaccharide deacetylase family protein [Xanthobacteraceae bacterium]|nr:polysaccharide deacetylase family protein [Xanthobacteraceae bacterium]